MWGVAGSTTVISQLGLHTAPDHLLHGWVSADLFSLSGLSSTLTFLPPLPPHTVHLSPKPEFSLQTLFPENLGVGLLPGEEDVWMEIWVEEIWVLALVRHQA